MKTNWQTKNFEDCLVKVVYTKKIQRKDFLESGDFPIISQEAEDINGYWDSDNDVFRTKTPVVIFGDHTQVLKYVDFDFVLGADGVKILAPKVFLDPRFFYYFLQSVDLKSLGYARHYRLLKEIEVSYPDSLAEQKRIVKTLDEVFEGITKVKENAEKNLKNSHELFESYLQSVFADPGNDWEEKSLEELGQITSSKRIYKKEYAKTGVPFYRIKEVKELAHEKNVTVELYISKERYKEIKDVFGIPKEGDILMTAVGTIGEIYVVGRDGDFYFKDGNVLWLKDFDSVDPYFLKFVLMSFVESIKKLSKGSAYSALTIEKIEKHKIFLPKSLSEQKAIVKKLDALSEQTKKLEAIYKQKIADLEELKKSVLKKAFAGEL